MLAYRTIALGILFIPMALLITYWDVRYRRIPNELVLLTFIGGVTLNTIFGGSHGFLVSLGGFAFAFGLMFFLHAFGTMGAGDVKLFAAIGAIIGVSQFFYGFLPGQRVPRFEVPVDRSYTLPYAVPICFGSVIAFFLFRA